VLSRRFLDRPNILTRLAPPMRGNPSNRHSETPREVRFKAVINVVRAHKNRSRLLRPE
jgi:hypothetical protein